MGGGKLTLSVRDLRVDYEIFADRRAALRKRVVTRTGPGRSLVHALKGVSFDAYEGDAVGVIGSNGSGKSTLLAALAGLLPPTAGEVLVADEPKLLGVGATLLPAASGYRNIRLGCLALGCRRTRSRTGSTRSSSSPSSARRSTGRCAPTPPACAPACTSPSPPRCSPHPAHRRGAGGGRPRFRKKARRADRRGARPRRHAHVRQPRARGDPPPVHPRRSGSSRASCGPTARRRRGRRVPRPHPLRVDAYRRSPGRRRPRAPPARRRPNPTRPSDTATTP